MSQVKSFYIKYMGCFKDAARRDLPYSYLNSSRMTLDMCAINCKNNGAYSYFGGQVG